MPSPIPARYLGVDVGKAAHYAVALDADGATVRRTSVVNDEAALRELVAWAKTHQAAVIVDQPGGGAALLLAVCWAEAVPVAYLHGTAMARARDVSPGEGKTDPKDAFVLADVARTHPGRLVWLTPTPEARAKLELLIGRDEDLRADANRLTNRLRDLLSTHWPALERARGERLATPAVLALLQRHSTGPALAKAGPKRVAAVLRAAGGREGEALAAAAGELAALLARRKQLEREVERAFLALPEAPVLASLPGIGPRLGARIACEIGDIARFQAPAQLAAYAGLGPVPRHSGTSRTGTVGARRGNRRLKHALHWAAFASLGHPPSRAYYDRKRAEGKDHDAAVRCLARRRVDVLHAMLRTGQPYHHEAPPAPPLAA